MRTCTKCGCYIPDNWTTCPACHLEKTTDFSNKYYHVKIFSDPYGIYETSYRREEDAFNYALLSTCLSFVKSVEIWNSQTKECLKIF